MMDRLQWVSTGGGPFIVLSIELAPRWRGVEGLSCTLDDLHVSNDLDTDYDRACDILDDLGTLDVGSGQALILGDEPCMTAFLPEPEGGLFIRWMHAEGETEVLRAVRTIPESIWNATPHRFVVTCEGAVLFDSAYAGDDLPTTPREEADTSCLRLTLSRGRYEIQTADYSPDESTRLILHRLRKLRG